jgi:hypothetical protein
VSTNYAESNSILASIWALKLTLFRKHEIEDVLSFTKRKLVKDPRTLSALKNVDNQQDLERVFEKNGTALAGMNLRSLEWLEKFGKFEISAWRRRIVCIPNFCCRSMHGSYLCQREYDPPGRPWSVRKVSFTMASSVGRMKNLGEIIYICL